MHRLTAVALATILTLILAAPAAAGHPSRALRGTVSGQVTYPQGACPVGVVTTSDASGWFLHLGRAAMHSTHCFAPPNLIVGGDMTFTAANGDQLFASYTGTATPATPAEPGDVIRADFSATITGGSGRFGGATGSFIGVGWVTFPGWEVPAWQASWSMSGAVAY